MKLIGKNNGPSFGIVFWCFYPRMIFVSFDNIVDSIKKFTIWKEFKIVYPLSQIRIFSNGSELFIESVGDFVTF